MMDKLIKIIDDNFKLFKLINTYSSGSQAIQWYIIQLSKINVERILFACGSYVSGEGNSYVPSLSTAALIEEHRKIKTENIDSMALKYTISFPHHIPDSVEQNKLQILESGCLVEIH
eukprot:3318244-Ditylum_brightwellii.AAC.1